MELYLVCALIVVVVTQTGSRWQEQFHNFCLSRTGEVAADNTHVTQPTSLLRAPAMVVFRISITFHV
jgi:hypothetical protein